MAPTPASSEITGSELLALIKANKAPRIIDVRSRQEFDEGHVPGAALIPFWRLVMGSEDLPAPHQDVLVLYCGHGPRAYLAGSALRRRGFDHIVYLKGHMTGWRKQGLPTEQ